MDAAVQAIGLLAGMGSFGKGLGLVLAVLAAVYMLRSKRTENEIARQQRAEQAMDNVQGDYAAERARRIEEEARTEKWRAAARWWEAKAHQQRHDRMGDRTYLMSRLELAGVVIPKLPDVPPLPALAEEDEG